jgi:nucleoside-diphosphate-sugar epimerase
LWCNYLSLKIKNMRVFVTGATGFVGSAIVNELINNGHQVLGLARSDESAKQLIAAGAEVHRGGLEDLNSLTTGAAAADGVIHTAFIHDFSKFKENCETDRSVIEALGAGLTGTDKPLIITSGTAILGLPRVSNELDKPLVDSSVMARIASEEAADSVAAKGVKVMVVRLPPSVHGDGDHGFVPRLIEIAKEKGAAAYVGEGSNLWPAVHRSDAAQLYRLVLEKGTANARYHASAEQGILMKDIVTAIGTKLNLPVVSKTSEEAAEHFGWIAHFAAINSPASSQITREQLGWNPTGRGLIEDLEIGTYFNS